MEVNNNITNTELLRKSGTSQDGLCLYDMYDKGTKQYKKYIVPEQNTDTFEKLTNELFESFDGMNDKKFIQKSMLSGLLGAAGGAGLSFILTRKSSTFKKALGMTGGAALFGLSGSAVYMFNILSKLYTYDKQIKALNVRPYNENTDKDISFKGNVLIEPASEKEVKELVKLFVQAFKQNTIQNSKLPKWIQKIDSYFCSRPFLWITKCPNVLTLTAKTDGKISGGYSMTIMPDSTAHLNFITLTPDKMRTKSGLEVLKSLGQNICDCADLNGVSEILFTTNAKNKNINLLLKRFSPEKIRDIGFGETEYSVAVKNLREKLDKLS